MVSRKRPKDQSVRLFVRALTAIGFVEGHNLKIEYRWAADRFGRCETLAAD